MMNKGQEHKSKKHKKHKKNKKNYKKHAKANNKKQTKQVQLPKPGGRKEKEKRTRGVGGMVSCGVRCPMYGS